jgi:hypothetical protein
MTSRRCVLALLVAALCAGPAGVALAQPGESSNPASGEAASARVNICGAGAGTLGVRVSAPYRGEGLAPWVRVTVQYYSTQDGGWHPAAAGDSGWFQAGEPGTGADTGYTFPYLAPRPGFRLVMRGIAQVQWRGPGATSTEVVTSECEVSSGSTAAP